MDRMYEEFKKGNCPDVCGQYSYVYISMQKLIVQDFELAYRFMPKVAMTYGHADPKVQGHLLGLLSDCNRSRGQKASILLQKRR